MKIIDLTMPLYDGMPVGHGSVSFKTHPSWPESFRMTETMSYEPDGISFHVYTLFCEMGTKFILPSYRKDLKDEATLDTVDMNKLMLRETVIVDIPKRDDEIVEADEFEAAFEKAPYHKGDALLIRTGWGDNERYFKIGHLWRENSPHFNDKSAAKLMNIMEKNGTDLFLWDLCAFGGLDKKKGTRGSFAILPGMMSVGGIVNAGAITSPRVKLIIMPLNAKGGHMSPCSVVALEE